MNSLSLLIVLLATASVAVAQNMSGSIEMTECRGCEDIVERPMVQYPAYVGNGPHKFAGDVGIQIIIDNQGKVVSAKGIFGHPYFRPMLEREALRAKFKSKNAEMNRTAILVFKVSPPNLEKSEPPKGIINGRALVLPKPEFSDDLKNLCTSGEVRLAVRVSESGSVREAKVLSGDELLHYPAIEAVRAAKFQPTHGRPVPYSGVVVYNFPSEKKCVDVGIVNGKWLTKPNSSVYLNAYVKQPVTIRIRVGIDVNSGMVVAARAMSGHPHIRITLQKQTMEIKFAPTFTNSRPVIAKGLIILRLFPDGTIKL